MRKFPSARGSPRPATRSVQSSKLYVLLILGVGFVLIFSYQAQIHHFGIREPLHFQHGALVASAKERTGLSSSLLGNKSPGLSTARSQTVSGTSTEGKALGSPPPPSRPRFVPRKGDWKDFKVEKYIPAVDSVQSNVVSSDFRFVIKVLSLNDNSSLVRCLESLSLAEYSGDAVDIHIYIDHFDIKESSGSEEYRRRLLLGEAPEQGAIPQKDNHVSAKAVAEDNREEHDRIITLPDRIIAGSDSVDRNDWNLIEQKLKNARQVLDYAETFEWEHGKKVIHYSTTTTGLQRQWLDAWWPSSDDEFALFVEDDAEVSPLFYRYVRALIATYYYQSGNVDSSLYGISLQRAQIVPGKLGRPLKVSQRSRLFKYQMVGTWGQVFFPKPWKEFRVWYDSKKTYDAKPVVDGMVTTDWYERHGEALFTPWFVKFAYNRGYFNLYTNFLRERVLSVTHRDFQGKSDRHAGCDSVLLRKNGTYDLDIWHMAATWNIKQYDHCFKEVKGGSYAKSPADAPRGLAKLSRNASRDGKRVLMVSTFGVPEALVRNWVCRAKALGVSNYVVVGEESDLLKELARKGLTSIKLENKHLTWSIEKDVKAVAEVLSMGYEVWFTRADTIWDRNPFELLEAIDTKGSDLIGLEEGTSALNLVFVRSTNVTLPYWRSLRTMLSRVGKNDSRTDVWEGARHRFYNGVKSFARGRVRKLAMEKVEFIEKEKLLELSPSDMSKDSEKTRILVLAGWDSSSQYQMKAKAEELSFWHVDYEWACSKLTC